MPLLLHVPSARGRSKILNATSERGQTKKSKATIAVNCPDTNNRNQQAQYKEKFMNGRFELRNGKCRNLWQMITIPAKRSERTKKGALFRTPFSI